MNGETSNVGRVEVYHRDYGKGAWGTVDAGTNSDKQIGAAQTICRQLGYDNVGSRYGTVTHLG